jgi:hypothetical protein
MMHLTFADKNLLLGTEAAELIVEYAAALARQHTADTVRVNAYGADGDKVEALLLLDEGAPLMVETSHSDLPDPENDDVVDYIRERMQELSGTNEARPVDPADDNTIADFERDFDVDRPGTTTT